MQRVPISPPWATGLQATVCQHPARFNYNPCTHRTSVQTATSPQGAPCELHTWLDQLAGKDGPPGLRSQHGLQGPQSQLRQGVGRGEGKLHALPGPAAEHHRHPISHCSLHHTARSEPIESGLVPA